MQVAYKLIFKCIANLLGMMMSNNSHVLEIIQGVIARFCKTNNTNVPITLINKLQCNYICLQIAPEQMIIQCEAFILPSLKAAKSHFVLTVEANLQGVNLNYWVDSNPEMHTIDIHGLLATREPILSVDTGKEWVGTSNSNPDLHQSIHYLVNSSAQNFGLKLAEGSNGNVLNIEDARHLSAEALANYLLNNDEPQSIKICAFDALSELQDQQVMSQPVLAWPFFDTDLVHAINNLNTHNKLSVLVADDSLPSQVATKVMLEMLGCAVTCAENGSSALLIAQQEPFDLLLLDERMPGMFGSDVAQQLIKQNTPNDNTPKVILTGITEEQQIAQLFEKGATHYLQKPVTKAVLEEFIKPWQAA